jgi:hypothetical protein
MGVRRTGSVQLRRLDRRSGSAVLLPAEYVRHHLELGCAVTPHRAQGVTTETAHVVVTTGTTRENLNVATTRGREANTAYVALDVLAGVAGRESVQLFLAEGEPVGRAVRRDGRGRDAGPFVPAAPEPERGALRAGAEDRSSAVEEAARPSSDRSESRDSGVDGSHGAGAVPAEPAAPC